MGSVRRCLTILVLATLCATGAFSQVRTSAAADSGRPTAGAPSRGRYLLPLAPDTLGLHRPEFSTFRFCVGAGVRLNDFSALEPLTGGTAGASARFSFGISLPFSDDPPVALLGEWSVAAGGTAGGSLSTFELSLQFRPYGCAPFRPIFGVGVGHTMYARDEYIRIDVSQTYPFLSAGLTLAPHTLDLLLTVPLAKEMTTTFESRAYTIRPSGASLSLLLSL